MKLALKLLKIICYLVLVIVIAGFAGVYLLPATGVCSTVSMSSIVCSTPFYKSVAELAISVVLLAGFTGLPLLLAGAGFIFFLRDVYMWSRARKLRKQP